MRLKYFIYVLKCHTRNCKWRLSHIIYALTTHVSTIPKFYEFKEKNEWIQAARTKRIKAAKEPKYYPYNSCKP